MTQRHILPLRKMISCGLTMLASVTILPVSLNGSSIPILNPGFENIAGEVVVDEFTFGPLNGWGLYDPSGTTSGGDGPNYFIGTLFPELDPIGNPGVYQGFNHGAIEGVRVGLAFNFASVGGLAEYGFRQTLSSTLQPNTTYTLEVEIGNIASATSRRGTFFNLEGFPGYRVDLLAGGTVIAQDNNSLAGTIPEGEWGTSTVTFTTGSTVLAGQNLGIRLVNLNQVDPLHPTSHLEVDFDDVRLDASPASVPEGSSALLPYIGLGMLLLLRHRWSCDEAVRLVPVRIS